MCDFFVINLVDFECTGKKHKIGHFSIYKSLPFFVLPGFAGELCNYEYNECESNPCLNGGQCIDHISGFSCKCTAGYTGKRCHVKVNVVYF